MSHTAIITPNNPALSELELSWAAAEFSAEDGIGPLRSLHEAGDALVAIASLSDDGATILGSGVMVGPGLLLTATHVLEEFRQRQETPIFMTFLPSGARAWLPLDMSVWTMPSAFDELRTIHSDISLVSCSLNSEAHPESPLMLAPMRIALPLVGERLWATGFRHQEIEGRAALVTPMISSGLVAVAYPNGRGEFLASPCFEVNMDTIGGMSAADRAEKKDSRSKPAVKVGRNVLQKTGTDIGVVCTNYPLLPFASSGETPPVCIGANSLHLSWFTPHRCLAAATARSAATTGFIRQ